MNNEERGRARSMGPTVTAACVGIRSASGPVRPFVLVCHESDRRPAAGSIGRSLLVRHMEVAGVDLLVVRSIRKSAEDAEECVF
jgi:hypothetical protein